MALKLPGLCLLLLLFNLSRAQEQKCQQSTSSCDECIESGPHCAWCTDTNATVRCHTLEGLQKAGCTDVFNPESRLQILRNENRPARFESVFMEPQEVSIHLRPGRSQTVQVNVFLPADQETTRLTLEDSSTPAGMNITLSRSIMRNSGTIEVSVDAAQCPSRNQNMTGPWFVYLRSSGTPQRVKLGIHLECHCSCSLNREEKSTACSSRGARVCGHCQCDNAYSGENCQTEEDSSFHRDERSCRPNPGAPLCSGVGTCVQGDCVCDKLVHPHHRYSGKFCECNNFICPYSNNKICGGNGRCECGHCICDVNWTGEGCDCTTNSTGCVATNGEVCNGRGTCFCGVCECNPPYMGPTCEECPICPGVCISHAPCVECRAYGTGDMASRCDKECNYFSLTMVDTAGQLPGMDSQTRYCRIRRKDDCIFYFTYTLTSSEQKVTVVRLEDCPDALLESSF